MGTKSVLSKDVVEALKVAGKELVLPVARIYLTKRYPVAVVRVGLTVVKVLLTKKHLKALKLEAAASLEGKFLRFDEAGVPVRALAKMPRAKKAK